MIKRFGFEDRTSTDNSNKDLEVLCFIAECKRDTQGALLLGYCKGWLDEMEFLTLNDLKTSENLDFD